jgi:hypothetical protein
MALDHLDPKNMTPKQLEDALEAVAGRPVTVTLSGWHWAALVVAWKKLLPFAMIVGSHEFVKDLTEIVTAIEGQAQPQVNGQSPDDVKQRLKDVGL